MSGADGQFSEYYNFLDMCTVPDIMLKSLRVESLFKGVYDAVTCSYFNRLHTKSVN